MKKLLFILSIGCLLIGCRSDLDLANVDKKAQLEMGVAFPLGNVKVTLSDFMGNIEKVYVDGYGVIAYRDTFSVGKSFHEVNLAERISTDTFSVDVMDKFAGLPIIGGVLNLPYPFSFALDFDMPIVLTGFNDQLSNERLDSVWIETSSFSTKLLTENFDINWNWIDSIVLDLGSQITCDNGDTSKIVFRANSGQMDPMSNVINTNIDHFTLDMIKNHSIPNPEGNVVNSSSFRAHVHITIPANEPLALSTASKLKYRLSVNFITFKAIWGYFKPSDDMDVESVMEFGDSWKSVGFLQHGHMPFSNPEIKVDIKTQIAGTMMIRDCYLFAEDSADHRTHALFGEHDGDTILPNVNLEGLALDTDPKKSPIGTYCDRYAIFNREEKKGQIHRLFGSIPSRIGYKFSVDFDKQFYPYQARLTPNDSIHIDMISTLPMTFSNGLEFHFNDTTAETNLSQFTVDSLLNGLLVVDTIRQSNLKVFMKAKNDMPLSLSLAIRCLDKNGDVIMDPDDNTKPFLLFEQDTTRIEAADFSVTVNPYDHVESWELKKPTVTLMTADLDKKRMNMLPQVNKLVYIAAIDDKSTAKAHAEGYNNLSLKNNYSVTLSVGISANIDAIVDLGGTPQQQQNNNNQ